MRTCFLPVLLALNVIVSAWLVPDREASRTDVERGRIYSRYLAESRGGDEAKIKIFLQGLSRDEFRALVDAAALEPWYGREAAGTSDGAALPFWASQFLKGSGRELSISDLEALLNDRTAPALWRAAVLSARRPHFDRLKPDEIVELMRAFCDICVREPDELILRSAVLGAGADLLRAQRHSLVEEEPRLDAILAQGDSKAIDALAEGKGEGLRGRAMAWLAARDTYSVTLATVRRDLESQRRQIDRQQRFLEDAMNQYRRPATRPGSH